MFCLRYGKMKVVLTKGSRRILSLVTLVYAATISYYEWISYVIVPQGWPSAKVLEMLYPDLQSRSSSYGDPAKSSSDKQDNIVRVLLVADPQIQGYRNEPSGVLGIVTRWDVDRYLRKTYLEAFLYVKPHIVIFLGDLLDEGSIASETEYQDYVHRFHRIFSLDGSQVYYVPGDNDIGGEGGEPVTRRNIDRFRQSFQSMSSNLWNGSLQFLEVNALTESVVDTRISRAGGLPVPKVLIGHMPLVRHFPEPFPDGVLSREKPCLVISAHNHKASLAQRSLFSHAYAEIPSTHRSDFSVFHLETNPTVVQEIVVPTCSYRMGVPEMGYGYAIIDLTANRLFYSILWLPSRYSHLFCEIWATCIFIITTLVIFLKANFRLSPYSRKFRH